MSLFVLQLARTIVPFGISPWIFTRDSRGFQKKNTYQALPMHICTHPCSSQNTGRNIWVVRQPFLPYVLFPFGCIRRCTEGAVICSSAETSGGSWAMNRPKRKVSHSFINPYLESDSRPQPQGWGVDLLDLYVFVFIGSSAPGSCTWQVLE